MRYSLRMLRFLNAATALFLFAGQALIAQETSPTYFGQVAEHIDMFLAGNEYVDQPNASALFFRNGFAWKEGGEFAYRPRFGVNLQLPNLQKKMLLKITSYSADDEELGVEEARNLPEESEEEYGTSLEFREQLGTITTRFRPGVKLREKKLEGTGTVIFSSRANAGIATFMPEFQFFARTYSGFGQFLGLNTDFQLTPANCLTLINEIEYSARKQTLYTNNGLGFVRNYNRTMSQQSALLFESTDKPTFYLEETLLRSAFIHRLYVNALHYRVTPYVLFEKAIKFHPKAGFDVMVEFIF
jgi:hypothetical protein